MYAGGFITKRENICKARYRAVISEAQFTFAMHNLFIQAQVSKGWDDDADKSEEVYEAFVDQIECQIEEAASGA